MNLGCDNPDNCKCNVDYKFKTENNAIDRLKTIVDSSKRKGFLIGLENNGTEPAYDMVFKINSTVLFDLRTTQSDCEFEEESKNLKVS